MITLLKNAHVFSPRNEGIQHLLIAGGKIVWIGNLALEFEADLEVEVVDLKGARLIPGLIDAHAHITGGWW